jgi:hypothetical protein
MKVKSLLYMVELADRLLVQRRGEDIYGGRGTADFNKRGEDLYGGHNTPNFNKKGEEDVYGGPGIPDFN